MLQTAEEILEGIEEKGEKGVRAVFYSGPSHNEKKSREEGRPIYDEVDFVRITIAGSRDIIERPATLMDKRRFARQYQQYKAGKEATVSGMPLELWPAVNKSQIEELKYFNIHSVEDLAAVSDENTSKFRGLANLKNKANAYLEAAKGNAPLEAMQAELEKRDAMITQLNDVIEKLNKRIEALEED